MALVFVRLLNTRQNLEAPLTLATDTFSAPFSFPFSPGTSSAFGLPFSQRAPGAPFSDQNAPVSLPSGQYAPVSTPSGQYAPVSPPSSPDASDKGWENTQDKAPMDMDIFESNLNVEGHNSDSFPASQNSRGY